MRLVIREYLTMLKESGELDALMPDLLLAMGLNPLSRPAVGPRQYGVDLPAIGRDPEDQRRKLMLVTIKQGDITRNNWDTGVQAVRPSLQEILDSYLRMRVRPEHQSLPKKIVLATGGGIKQDVEQDWVNFIHRHGGPDSSYGPIEFDFWGGDRLAVYIERFLMDEFLFPESAQKQIRKTIALADQNEDEPRHYYDFVHASLFHRDLPSAKTASAKRTRQKALRFLNLSVNIVFHWCQEADNLRPALLCAEHLILRTWDWMRKQALFDCQTTMRGFSQLFDTYLNVGHAFVVKLEPYCLVRDGLFGQGADEIEYPLRTFEVIGFLASLSLANAYLLTNERDVDKRRFLRDRRDYCTKVLSQLIENNPPAYAPRFDSHAIEVALGLLALTFGGYEREATTWVNALGAYIHFAYRVLGEHFPIASDSFDDLVAMSVGQGPPKEKLMELSTLLPMLGEWHAILEHATYGEFRQAVTAAFSETNLQQWYPDEATDEFLYKSNAGHESGVTLTSIQLPETVDELRENVLRNLSERSTVELSCVKYGWALLSLIASRHFRTPVCPFHWQEQVR